MDRVDDEANGMPPLVPDPPEPMAAYLKSDAVVEYAAPVPWAIGGKFTFIEFSEIVPRFVD